VIVFSPDVVTSNLADSISGEAAREAMAEFRRIALGPADIARAVCFANEQSGDVNVSDLIMRPTATRNRGGPSQPKSAERSATSILMPQFLESLHFTAAQKRNSYRGFREYRLGLWGRT
jgi:hypothetical protein